MGPSSPYTADKWCNHTVNSAPSMSIDNSCRTIVAAESATILKPDLFTTSKYDPDQVLNSIAVISSHPVLIEASHTSTLPGVVTSTEYDTTLRESKKRTYDSPTSFSDGHGSKMALVDVSDHLSDCILDFTMKTFYDCGELELVIWFTVLMKMELSMLVIVIWLWCIYYNIIPRPSLQLSTLRWVPVCLRGGWARSYAHHTLNSREHTAQPLAFHSMALILNILTLYWYTLLHNLNSITIFQ